MGHKSHKTTLYVCTIWENIDFWVVSGLKTPYIIVQECQKSAQFHRRNLKIKNDCGLRERGGGIFPGKGGGGVFPDITYKNHIKNTL